MREEKENENSHKMDVHPAVLQVATEESRRWSAAIWSGRGGSVRLKKQIEMLVEGTVLAQSSMPARDSERVNMGFDSFDLLFFEAPPQQLVAELEGQGWQRVGVGHLSEEEHERLTVFQNEARKAGRSVGPRPETMMRLEVAAPTLVDTHVTKAAKRTQGQLGGELWGERPGNFSRVFCDELRKEVQIRVTPDEAGLAGLEDVVVGRGPGRLQLMHPMVFQAICDFMGVVLQASHAVETQWAPCRVDEKTGLAEAPILRIRPRQGRWKVLPVGRDIIRRTVVPWGRDGDEGRRLVRLLKQYRQQE